MLRLIFAFGLMVSLVGAIGYWTVGNGAHAASSDQTLLLVLQAKPADGGPVDADTLASSARTIERRAEGLGIDKPVVWTSGDDEIVIELPGVGEDRSSEITKSLTESADLEIIDTQGESLTPGTIVTTNLDESSSNTSPVAGKIYTTVVSGLDINEAYVASDSTGQPVVAFSLNDEASKTFFDFTSTHIGQLMAIVLNKKVLSSPVINGAISGQGIIAGVSPDEVNDLANQLNSGVLTVPLSVVSSKVLDRVPEQAPLTPAEASPSAGTASPVATGDYWTADQRSGTDSLQWSAPPAMVVDPAKQYRATIVTNYGEFTIQFFAEDAPETVNNFVCLARAGFYDNTTFHRVVKGFVIQGGDPTWTGTGGPGYSFDDEAFSHDYAKGTVAMANAGPDTNGSQFFVTLVDLQGQLPKNYTIFGTVESGQDVVDKIGNVPTKASAQGEQSSPVDPVKIEKVTIEES